MILYVSDFRGFDFPFFRKSLLIKELISIGFFRYESEFFQNVVNGGDIVSWAAVDRSRPDGHSEELIGFVTAKIVLAKESEVSFFSLFLENCVFRLLLFNFRLC